MSDTQYGMVIDLRGCMGCQTCVISCKTSNEVSGDLFWSHVLDFHENETYMTAPGSKPSMKFRPVLCNHCADPACVKNCPTGAMHKDGQTGVVSVDQGICIGCKTCEQSCPYGAPVVDPEKTVSTKCNLCAGRIEKGEEPYCVISCPARVRYCGDISDPNSTVAKMIEEHNAEPYKTEEGTGPSVYYIPPTQ